MKIEQDKRRFDFHAIGKEIKEKRKASGLTQEQLAYIVDREQCTIMYRSILLPVKEQRERVQETD